MVMRSREGELGKMAAMIEAQFVKFFHYSSINSEPGIVKRAVCLWRVVISDKLMLNLELKQTCLMQN